MKRALAALVATIGIFAARGARGDAVPQPPQCADGARGTSSHEGSWCEPFTCATDDDCKNPYPPRSDLTCHATGLCQHDEEYTIYPRIPDAGPTTATRTVTAETCTQGGPVCTDPRDTCVVALHCAPPSPPTTAKAGCACDVPFGAGAFGGAALAAAGALAAIARRRARKA